MARGKSISHFCGHCERMVRMEMVGTVENQPEKTWYRCTRCRHALLLDMVELRRFQEDAKKKVERADCSEYRPENTYSVGQAIFHAGWDDMGKIVSKERTSGGARAIVVSFEKLGERKLLESVIAHAENDQ
jgi:DNA-directed RNA polymerase subunit RPC12/RpoP